jgi:hypothetical protein
LAGGRVETVIPMVWALMMMLVVLLLAALVAVYVAFPRRGAEVPAAPWVGDALRRGVAALPTLDNQRPRRSPQRSP